MTNFHSSIKDDLDKAISLGEQYLKQENQSSDEIMKGFLKECEKILKEVFQSELEQLLSFPTISHRDIFTKYNFT